MAFTLHDLTRSDKLAYTPAEAASMLGVSRRTFDRRILGQLRIVREGRCILVPRRELERYIEHRLARLES